MALSMTPPLLNLGDDLVVNTFLINILVYIYTQTRCWVEISLLVIYVSLYCFVPGWFFLYEMDFILCNISLLQIWCRYVVRFDSLVKCKWLLHWLKGFVFLKGKKKKTCIHKIYPPWKSQIGWANDFCIWNDIESGLWCLWRDSVAALMVFILYAMLLWPWFLCHVHDF
jgi:hypothetical protein